MADGNELDDDLDEDSVEFTPEEDGVIGFVLPRVGFPTVEQQKWADSITRELMSARTENRVLRSQVDNANRLAAETSAVLGEVIYADSDESLEEAEPLRAPSKPLVTSRMGNLEILWDGNDFEGGPMAPSLTGINVYAVKTSDVPANADFSLRTPYDDGLIEEDPDGELPSEGVIETIVTTDDCEISGNWMDLFDNPHPTTNTPAPHQGLYSISSTSYAYREVGVPLPSEGTNEISFWVYNQNATDIENLELIVGGNGIEVAYPGPVIPAGGGWTQMVVPDIGGGFTLDHLIVLRNPLDASFMLIDDFVVTNRVSGDPPEPTPTPATVWPPTSIGTILPSSTGANVIFSDLGYNEEYTIWFLGVDTLGTTSDPSERVTASVQPLVNTDIIGQIIAGANIVDDSITASDKIIGNTITGGLIQALAINAGHIQANAIEADKIAVGALDGKLITGAIIRTAATGQRVQLDEVGLRAFNAADEVTASLTAGDGGLVLSGSLIATDADISSVYSTGRTASLQDGRLYLRDVYQKFGDPAEAYLTTSGFYGKRNSWFDFEGNGLTNSMATGVRISTDGALGILLTTNNGPVRLSAASVQVKNSWNSGFQRLGSMTYYNDSANWSYFGGGDGTGPTTSGQTHICMNNGALSGSTSIAWITNNGTQAFAVTADGGLNMPKMPYAMATGSVSPAATGGGSTASFPSGRFRATPRIQLTVTSTTNNVVAVPWFNAVSSSSITGIRIFTLGGVQVAGKVEWLAVQMTTSAGSG